MKKIIINKTKTWGLCIMICLSASISIKAQYQYHSNLTDALKIDRSADIIEPNTEARNINGFNNIGRAMVENRADVFIVTVKISKTELEKSSPATKNILSLKFSVQNNSTLENLFSFSYEHGQGWKITRSFSGLNGIGKSFDYYFFDNIGTETTMYTFIVGKTFAAIAADTDGSYKLSHVYFGLVTPLELTEGNVNINDLFFNQSSNLRRRITVNKIWAGGDALPESNWRAYRMEGNNTDLDNLLYPPYSQERLVRRLSLNSSGQANPNFAPTKTYETDENTVKDIVKESVKETFKELSVSPNPSTTGIFNVDFTLPTDGRVSFKLIKPTGELVLGQDNLKFFKGVNRHVIKTPNTLPKGVYMLNILSGKAITKTVKLIVQ